METALKAGERIDDLQRDGLRIIQREDGFRFGTDAVLLADFAAVRRGERVCDMGTGTGVLPLLLSARAEGTTFDTFEVQRDVADMAQRSVALNGLQARIRVHHADCREAGRIIGCETVQLVVTNPPYTALGAGLVSPEETRALSRSDSDCPLADWMAACARVLQNGACASSFPDRRTRPSWCSSRAKSAAGRGCTCCRCSSRTRRTAASPRKCGGFTGSYNRNAFRFSRAQSMARTNAVSANTSDKSERRNR